MKLNYKSIFAATTLLFLGANANAGVIFDLYTGATAGLGGQRIAFGGDHKTEHASSFGAVAGIDIPFVRVEAEYNYMNGKNFDLQIGALNAYVKLPGLVVLTPYVGAGIGVPLDVDIDKDLISQHEKSNNALYQAMLGTTLDIPALPFKIDVEGRVLHTPRLVEIAAPDTDISATHYDARVKLRYIF